MSRSQRRTERGRPVLAAQLVEHGAVDAGPGVLLERRALGRVVAVDRVDERLEAAGDEVLDLAAGRHLADLLVDDVLHHRGEGEHQAVAQRRGPSCGGIRATGRGVSSEDRRRVARRGAVASVMARSPRAGGRWEVSGQAEPSASPKSVLTAGHASSAASPLLGRGTGWVKFGAPSADDPGARSPLRDVDPAWPSASPMPVGPPPLRPRTARLSPAPAAPASPPARRAPGRRRRPGRLPRASFAEAARDRRRPPPLRGAPRAAGAGPGREGQHGERSVGPPRRRRRVDAPPGRAARARAAQLRRRPPLRAGRAHRRRGALPRRPAPGSRAAATSSATCAECKRRRARASRAAGPAPPAAARAAACATARSAPPPRAARRPA